MQSFIHYISPLGPMTLAADGDGLIGVWFEGQKHFGSTLMPEAIEGTLPVLEDAVLWLDVYFAGHQPLSIPRLSLHGTPFQQAVWTELLSIPYAQTVTYKHVVQAVASRLGLPSMSAQAVGGAIGRNPISIIVPCHRVVATGGALSGYAGGVERKEWLLEWELVH